MNVGTVRLPLSDLSEEEKKGFWHSLINKLEER